MRNWVDALDDFERRLADQRASLDTADVAVGTFVPPAGLGPLPIGLAPRARTLLAEARALETEMAERMSAFRLTPVRPRRATMPVYLDTRA